MVRPSRVWAAIHKVEASLRSRAARRSGALSESTVRVSLLGSIAPDGESASSAKGVCEVRLMDAPEDRDSARRVWLPVAVDAPCATSVREKSVPGSS